MKLLLLCLGLTLVCAHEEQNHDVVRSNFDLSKISGRWYSNLLASDEMEKIEASGSMRIFVEYIQALANNSLLFKYHKKVDGNCTELFILSDETAENGVYSVVYDGYNTFRIIGAVYDHYLILHVLNFNNGKQSQVMELYGRKPYVNSRLQKRFRDICRKYGIAKKNILDLTKVDRCLHARKSQWAQAPRADEAS